MAGIGGCGSSSTSSASTSKSSSSTIPIGVDLTYNNTAFWAAYINYESQYASQLHVKLIGPLLAAANASLQNQQIEELVNEGAKSVIVNPETATSLGPAISYATSHHVKLISVDTIVGVGKVYMVVRASNLIYGLDACAYIGSRVKSGYVLDLEGDLTSSNGADRTNAFNACMAANDPGVTILKDPTVWVDSTAVTDAQNAVNGQVPVSLIVTAIIFIGTGLFLRCHRAGRAIYAVGGNHEAARAAGIKVDRIRIGVYVVGSLLAAVGGLMEAGRVSAVTGTQGYQEGIIFAVFAAAVIGGVSLRGGRGNMVGAASGVILLGLVQNILDLSNVSNYWIEAVDGGVILLALLLARIIGGEATAE
jgi:ABC-type sugar transport system substrate-binding protein